MSREESLFYPDWSSLFFFKKILSVCNGVRSEDFMSFLAASLAIFTRYETDKSLKVFISKSAENGYYWVAFISGCFMHVCFDYDSSPLPLSSFWITES